ncbi:DNA cytosine methyltransferase [Burkholderia multivorans]|uniref:DNA cytosine methyltransferase n=1 Tax=Burkholderia multivorans TaxID=87883 RepID=UPI0009BD14C5|nr:DNA cytosine methyltransferase [Burkholderia multivorans]
MALRSFPAIEALSVEEAMDLRFGSVCSGIEAASCAWHPLGWKTEFVSEIEPFPSAVLAHHYPTVPNLGDMTKFKEWPDAAIDLLVGGTPCQSFSVAGLRKGLADPRGNLMLTYLAIAERYAPRWLVWENVPGVLSSNRGRDFGTFLGGLAELGYGFAYRVLDAQFFGVAQRRRRVFVVGHLGDWRRAAAVLFERESLLGHPAPRRETRQGVAPTLSARTKGGGGLGTDFELDGGLIHAIQAGALRQNVNSGPDGVGVQADIAYTLEARAEVQAVAFAENSRAELRLEGGDGQRVGAISTGGGKPGQGVPMIATDAVRRLTPRECERLQGFPDDYTLINVRGKPAADGPRYKALGNSMAIPVMSWLGQRIQMVEDLCNNTNAERAV